MREMEMSEFNVPKLRFREFEGEWVEKRLGDFILSHKGGASLKPKDFVKKSNSEVIPKKAIVSNGKLVLDKDNPTFCSDDFFEKNNKSVVDNSYLITTLRDLVPSGPNIGYIVKNYSSKNLILAQGVYGFKISEKLDEKFLTLFSNRIEYRRLMQKIMVGSTQVHIRNQDFFGIKLTLPQKPEQQKIANFLTSIDQKIEQLTKKEKLLVAYKKGVMQKIFSQEIRFRDENGEVYGDWVERKFKEVFERITTKNKENNQNVLTISAQQGLINQQKYFNKSVSAKDVTGYYLLHKNDFAYNKSYSKGYPMGAIKRLKNYEKGVVSTLYICFRVRNDSVSFMEQFFNAGNLNQELHKIAQEGARNHGLLNMSVVEFFNDISLSLPQIEEQTKIANFLSFIDKKIEQVNRQIEESKGFKKGLLQGMFV